MNEDFFWGFVWGGITASTAIFLLSFWPDITQWKRRRKNRKG